MRLYIMRHGPAEDRAPSGRDFDRVLTSVGRRVVERSVRELHLHHEAHREAARGRDDGGALAGSPLRVISSPFLRARETAEIVAGRFARDVEISEDLGAEQDLPMALVDAVLGAGSDAILVGHQPTVEELVRALVRGGPTGLTAGFRTAMIVSLDRDTDEKSEGRWLRRGVIDPHASTK